MMLAYDYNGHSFGLAGTIAIVVALVLRLAWMYRRRR